MKNKLEFNRRRRFKSKSLYRFNNYLNTFERSSRILFIKSYYNLKANELKFNRLNIFSNKSKSKLNSFVY